MSKAASGSDKGGVKAPSEAASNEAAPNEDEAPPIAKRRAMGLEVFLLQRLHELAERKNGEKKLKTMYNKLGKKAKKEGDVDTKEMRKLLTALKVPKATLKEAGSKTGKVTDLPEETLVSLKSCMLASAAEEGAKSEQMSFETFKTYKTSTCYT